MIFSRSAKYAIRAMTFLATLPPGRLAGVREISEVENIPTPFLSKILQTLVRHRLIRSFKGLYGGYELAKPPDSIALKAIIGAIDDIDRVSDCILGMSHCSEENSCPLHHTWKEMRENMVEMMEKKTLADLAENVKARTSPE